MEEKKQRNEKFIEEDPIETLSKLGKEKLKVKTIETFKKEAREDIEKAALRKIESY